MLKASSQLSKLHFRLESSISNNYTTIIAQAQCNSTFSNENSHNLRVIMCYFVLFKKQKERVSMLDYV